ncbi:MAG: MarC family protein [Nanoarchaeota archaeon]
MIGLIEAFTILFVIMNPIAAVPLFIELTRGMPRKVAAKHANKAITVAGAVLFVFLFLGLRIFDVFGINIDSFEIAGGIILLIIGVFYVFSAYDNYIKSHSSDLSVAIGTPLLTGPGVITTTIILTKEAGILTTVIAAFLTLLITWIILINSSKLYKILNKHWVNVASRVIGILLVAIAVEFIRKGILSIIANVD